MLRRLGPEVGRIEHKTFDLENVCPTGHPQVVARLAGKTEFPPKQFPSNLFVGAGAGGGVATVGILATMAYPMAQGAAVGGILLGPTFLVMGVVNDAHMKAIKAAMSDVDLPARLQSTAQSRLARRLGGDLRPDCRVEIMILHYGLIDDGHTGQLSFTFDAEVRIVVTGTVVFSDKFLMGPFRRSDDVPPPHRATFGEFGRDGGDLTRRTLEDSTEVIAAVIAARLEGGR